MKIVFLRSASKEFDGLPKHVQKQIQPKIAQLSKGLSGDCKKLQGYDQRYRLRVGEYRIVFEVQKGKLVILIIKIGLRKDVYR